MCLALIVLSASSLWAENRQISTGEKALNFGLVYAAQWGTYYISQHETIREKGSFRNWYTNIGKAHLDKDSYDFNLVLHTVSGSNYVLWFRSRGYSRISSLFWSTFSSFMFEFTIETITEPPSYQDLYQTPILGAVVAFPLDYLSVYFLKKKHWAFKTLGYLLNPYRLVPGSMIRISKENAMLQIGARF